MEDIEYTHILCALQELPFPVGKRTLVDVVHGAVTQKIVTNDAYMDAPSYGTLEGCAVHEIERWVEKLLSAGCIRYTHPPGKPFVKVLEITARGVQEIKNPVLATKTVRPTFSSDALDEESNALMQAFSFFLEKYNPEQQHAIVCPAKRILCVAGAGSGKTTVLTKRIEFLVKHRGIQPKQILAITFTRKACAEMKARLKDIPATILTFNGLCERILLRAGKQKPIVTYGQKRRLFGQALLRHGLTLPGLLHEYFSPAQRRGTTQEELSRRIMGDVFSILDHFSNEDQEVPTTGKTALATTLLALAQTLQEEMDAQNLRDYSGQLKEALALLRENSQYIPKYSHILVDEYQDVNPGQVELLKLLAPTNLFVVGDPRQSIFGWRGSKVEFITRFRAEVTIQLTTNYRSMPEIISVMNNVISRMKLPDLLSARQGEAGLQELQYNSEDEERKAVATLLFGMQGKEVFVLARTNNQLDELSAILRSKHIAHNTRKEEDENEVSGIVLSTVHAIKGLEAQTVILLGAGSRYFPCKVSDHPVIDLIKENDLDREEEELRLLYVAISRAKDALIITHANSRTYFLDEIAFGVQEKKRQHTLRNDALYETLRAWRAEKARERGLPAYTILSDKTLRNLTELLPHSTQELLSIHGMGPAKVSQYGEQLLELLIQ